MKILIVAATKFEINPLLEQMEINTFAGNSRIIKCTYKELEVDYLITGVGMVTTAYYTGKILDDTYDMALNIGICGTFNANLEIGSVVNVYEDRFAEMGAEDGNNFLTLEELKLEAITTVTNIEQGEISHVMELLPKVNGITVNKVHGNAKSIKNTFERFHPIVESMEGAAFMFVCEKEKIPYLQIRAISNVVEKRNREAWNIPLAIENLNKKIIEFLDHI
ncbi:MAG TPA: futalosine hydrolase [Bacteroidia bacterium]|jgi:futalosine hydrolase|nr:futalosine hydrolase [Bacteroidia bacterium]